jgi:hypothetical protein
MSRLSILLAAFLLLLVTQTLPAGGQQPPPPPRPAPQPPGPDDVLWTIAPDGVLADTRIAHALATLVDAQVRPTGARVYYAEQRGPTTLAYIAAAPFPADQVPLLLAAAGFPGGLGGVRVVGPCLYSVAPAVVPSLESDGLQIASYFHKALIQAGLTVQPCVATASYAQAHIVVWRNGPFPAVPTRQRATFLDIPGTSGAPAPPRPPTTGNAGLSAVD